jgi:putative acetyltransferase
VVELNGTIVGYADFQLNGYMNHFYVSSYYTRRGIGSFLMKYIMEEAALIGNI